MVSIDSETTGLDTRHSARPFAVTMCEDDGTQTYYEWPVDPFTRRPDIPPEDLREIGEYLFASGPSGPIGDANDEDGYGLVLQNSKFDFAALDSVGLWDEWDVDQAWGSVRDTLLAGHLLASNQPHDLTTMATVYLGIDIAPYEDALEEIVKQLRREVRKKSFILDHGEWNIAEAGMAESPSAKERLWKNDLWLPRAYAQALSLPESDPRWSVLRDYANTDSSVTLALWKKQRELIRKKGLWEIYLERLKVLPIAYTMESRGVTLSKTRLDELTVKYEEESEKAGRRCTSIAASLGYELTLPKSGNNKSLTEFAFNHLKLPPLNCSAKTGVPSLAKEVLAAYVSMLPDNSKGLLFVKSLEAKRKRDTALSYMTSYSRFWKPYQGEVNASSGIESNRHRTEDPSAVLEEDREEPRMLALDRESISRKRVRSIPSTRGVPSTQSKLYSSQRIDTGGSEGSPQVRQSPMRSTGSSLPRDERRELGGHGQEEQTSQRRTTPSIQDNRARRNSDTSSLRYEKKDTNTTVSRVQYQSSPHARDRQEKVLEAPSIRDYYKLHPNLNPTGTSTLRWSSNNPNEQNISKKEGFNIRYCFGPAPGREWWSCDYENIELRIPAYESGQQAMIDLFEKPDEPPYFGSYHLMNASIIYPDLFWPLAEQKGAFKKKYGATWYQWCKNFGFAVQYGAVPESGTADRAAHKVGAHRLVAEGLKEMTRLNTYWVKFAERCGYVETIPDKNVNPTKGYPLYCTRSEYGKILPTVPLSYHIQSTAMWCTAKAMVRCQKQLDDWRAADGFDGHIALQVHDEMDFDFPKGGKANLWRVNRLRQLMEESGEDIGVPLKVSLGYHPDNWSEEQEL